MAVSTEESNKYGSDNVSVDEFSAMLGKAPEKEEVVEESAAAEEPIVEEEVEEQPVEEEAPEEEAEVVEPEEEDRYKTLLELYNKQSLELLEMKARGSYASEVADKVIQEKGLEQPPEPKVEKVAVDTEKIKKAVIEGDDEALVSVLDKFAGDVSQYVENRIERFLQGTPKMMQSIANETLAFAEAKNKFYKDNPDLLPYTPVVGTVSLQVFSNNPGKPLVELMGEVEKETRRILGLKKSITDKASSASPAFVRGKSKRQPMKEALSGVKGEMAEMLKARQQY